MSTPSTLPVLICAPHYAAAMRFCAQHGLPLGMSALFVWTANTITRNPGAPYALVEGFHSTPGAPRILEALRQGGHTEWIQPARQTFTTPDPWAEATPRRTISRPTQDPYVPEWAVPIERNPGTERSRSR